MYRKTPWAWFIGLSCFIALFIDKEALQEAINNNAIDRKFKTEYVVIERIDTIYLSAPSAKKLKQ